MRLAGGFASAYVADVSAPSAQPVFRWREHTARILASNTKLFTTTAALARFGTEGTLGTEVLGTGELDAEGVYRGSIYLRGGGDPTFGSRRFTQRSYSGGATVQDLAGALEESGIERVTGRVYGDESAFDSLRGGPDSGYGVSIWVGPLSGLCYNRGLFTEGGRGFQANPPAFAAARLDDALEARHIGANEPPRRRDPGRGDRPGERRLAAHVAADPAHEQAVRQLLRRDAAQGPRTPGWRRRDDGARRPDCHRFRPTARRAPAARGRLGAGPRQSRLAVQHREAVDRDALRASDARRSSSPRSPIAGSDGTLFDRMRPVPPTGAAIGKTGTLSNVSALSGYCEAGERRQLRVLHPHERRLSQRAPAACRTRMLQAIAKYGS